MPFIAQCPHPNCRKFQLLEDKVRGGTVACLLCKQPIAVSAAPPGEPPRVSIEPPRPGEASAPPIIGRRTRACPKCGTTLYLPADGPPPPKAKCAKCGHVFAT